MNIFICMLSDLLEKQLKAGDPSFNISKVTFDLEKHGSQEDMQKIFNHSQESSFIRNSFILTFMPL